MKKESRISMFVVVVAVVHIIIVVLIKSIVNEVLFFMTRPSFTLLSLLHPSVFSNFSAI